MTRHHSNKWQFWVDRGGTFTDVIGKSPNGDIISRKYLSDNPNQYADAAMFGIDRILESTTGAPSDTADIEALKMGTTVGTNALLERKGERVALLVTRGFADLLHIGYQHRRELFSLQQSRPDALYETVGEIEERLDADGHIHTPLNEAHARQTLRQIYNDGIRTVAIVLLHGYQYPVHEKRLATLASKEGFSHVSVSHRISPSIKAVGRGDTTVVDAYLSPLLCRYIDSIRNHLRPRDSASNPSSTLMFMQSHGGLIDADHFLAKDSILSGPAGGIVGAVTTCREAGFDHIITFDMGGTSTDVAHFNGEYELNFESEIAGIRLQCPMLNIHTVAAGGGSILKFEDNRCQVGPESAGAHPGPASYRNGGPLAVTDCNVALGKIIPAHFPKVFGKKADAPLDKETTLQRFKEITTQINAAFGTQKSVAEIAEGFLDIAVENMAQAIKRISVQRGYNVQKYTLCCFGGAGGQHACKTADVLGMTQVFIHAAAGVLSALGMGLADNVVVREKSVLLTLVESAMPDLHSALDNLTNEAKRHISPHFQPPTIHHKALLRYDGSDSTIPVPFDTCPQMHQRFETLHLNRFGFTFPDKSIQVARLVCEVRQEGTPKALAKPQVERFHTPSIKETTSFFSGGRWHTAAVYNRDRLLAGAILNGPCIVTEPNSTIIVEPGWQATLQSGGHLILQRIVPIESRVALGTNVDPVLLELFNNRFMNVAEQMGYTLQNTAASVNIRERLDFSCAVFDANGDLIANAPHIPVHLGSMAKSVKAIIEKEKRIHKGDVFLLNSPYHGGTHLPDLTVITPVFIQPDTPPDFFVASRGHHADIGGITPGSIPPGSTHIDEEGVLFDGIRIAQNGVFQEHDILARLTNATHPARDPACNLADIKAQMAANAKGAAELATMVSQLGDDVVRAYMTHVKNNAEASVRALLCTLHNGEAAIQMDTGDTIAVRVQIDPDRQCARIDFSGTSPQNPTHNFNAPLSITHAAVLYVFRTLTRDIPLNSGCLVPLEIIVPDDSILNPTWPAAVVAGNVETSQYVVDVLLQALGKLAGSQGTMNNVTFGNAQHQYYETICGGSGAGAFFDGTDAIQCHMTNSRITDPEILETRFPVTVEQFAVRQNSGGNGLFRGGNGAIRAIRFNTPMTVSIVSSHRTCAPKGLQGGQDGACGKNTLRKVNGAVHPLGACDSIAVSPGDTLIIETPGGGGFGEPECHNIVPRS
ncbi:MAG: hydantoinase B/oxoprolinase family protein [Deltaproteobacteria bacterium]|nr:hydantoinase B/oxoprolinase family protein [Deltaproteobacteria bacterium]